jgi:hypothetical protein
MIEGRGERLGKYIAKSINQFADPEFQKVVKDPSYKQRFIEIMKIPFEPRQQGQPNPKQNISTLEDIPYEEFHIKNPEHYAALLRERGHMKYNANTANRVRISLLDNL